MVSASEASLIRRASVLMVEMEILESKFSEAGGAEERSLDQYQRCLNTLRRTLESLGLQRRQKPVQGLPTLLGDGL